MYSFLGQFYRLPGTDGGFRSSLDITLHSSVQRHLDALVIMMNPGGSHPLCDHLPKCLHGSCKHDESCQPTPTNPDDTQKFITELMGLKGWEKVRVINLSDVRGINLNAITVSSLPASHSIFDDSRQLDLKAELNNSPLVVCAWGSPRQLMRIARSAKSQLEASGLPYYGIPNKPDWAYRHPSRAKSWAARMAKLIP
jgi:hypothetical protein